MNLKWLKVPIFDRQIDIWHLNCCNTWEMHFMGEGSVWAIHVCLQLPPSTVKMFTSTDGMKSNISEKVLINQIALCQQCILQLWQRKCSYLQHGNVLRSVHCSELALFKINYSVRLVIVSAAASYCLFLDVFWLGMSLKGPRKEKELVWSTWGWSWTMVETCTCFLMCTTFFLNLIPANSSLYQP